MIVGTGLIGSAFEKYDEKEIVFFASGVSNSQEKDKNQFLREENLVRKTLSENKDKLFIYFSTCSIYDSSKYDSSYVLHKLHMEEIIKENSNKYLILRVSNAVGNGGNPNLLMNYLSRSIKNKDSLTIHTKATRNLIDIDDIASITLHCIENQKLNRIVNLAYRENFSIFEIIQTFETFTSEPIKVKLENKGESYSIDTTEINNLFKITDKKDYLHSLIEKYYRAIL